MKKFKKLLEISRYPLSYWRGMKFYRNRDWDRASIYFKKAVNAMPMHPQSNFKLGMCYFKQRKWELAYQFISVAVDLLPSKEEWKVQLYQSQLKLNNINGIKLTTSASLIEEELIRKRLETEKPTGKLYGRLAELLHKQGKSWQEVDALQKAVELSPKNAQLYRRLGESLETMKRYEEAAFAYKTAIKLKGNKADYELFYQYGFCLEKIDAKQEDIIQAYTSAIEKDDTDDSKKFGIGAIHERKGRWPEATDAYLTSFSNNPSNGELCYRVGFAYQRCYDWDNAEKYYLLALKLDTSNPNWYYQVGFVREKKGAFLEATEYYKYATNKKYTPYWMYRLGLCLTKANKHKEATLAFLKTKKSFKEEYLEESELSIFLDDNKIDKLQEKLSLDYSNLELWHKLSNIYFSRGDLVNAEKHFYQILLRTNEYNSDLYYKYGLILAKLGNFKRAARFLRNCRQIQTLHGLPDRKFNNDEGFRQAAIYSEYYDVLNVNKKIILFESFSGVAMSCNPLAIFLEMKKDSRFDDFLFVWVINDITTVSDEYKKHQNVVFVQKDSDLYLRYLCHAYYLVNNATFPPYFTRKKEQKYLNTWHGTPWKTLGKDIKNSFMELKNSQRNFLQSTHMLSPNPHTTWVLADRYDIKEIYLGKFLEAGYPRIDLTLNISDDRKSELRRTLNIDPTKKVVLYAPTWRGTLGSPEVEADKLISEIKALKDLGINLLFRGHYFVQKNAYESGIEQYIVPEFINTNELLSIVDILITDYSSIGFDYMATGRPIVYYIDDYEEYKADRGLYFDYDKLPGEMATNINELKKAILNEVSSPKAHSLYLQAQKEFTPYENGQVASRVINWFIHGLSDENEINISSQEKKSILIFGGEFLPNGITTSIINLLNNIDYEKYTVSLLIDPNAISKEEKRLAQFARVSPKVNIIPRVGRMNRSIEDDWVEAKANQYKFVPKNFRAYFERAYNKEFRRIVGYSKFDALVEFTGYSRFWAYLLGSAKIKNVVRTIYQHNDKYGEWTLRFPYLENTFSIYYMYDHLMSVSKPTMDLNIKNLCERFSLDINKFDYCDNVQDPESTIIKSKEELSTEDEKYFENCKGKIFINLARLSPEKDQAKLIRSFRILVNKYPNSRLLILGDGPLYNDLSNLIKELNLESNVFLVGIRFNPFPFLKRADCFVLSSNHEGQPMTLFEAMILEKPIIATDIVGSRSALEGRPGHLVPNSEEGLYQGLSDFIEGKLHFSRFDYNSYQNSALNMFYSKILSK
ncbi:CDP-glycerol glycerophosphotransferase family protein [Actinobacillus genomosp. 1]|uniref:CDP-glycerol glycerophosphotransferase family protein n=1 Tax=Actinobacillus genomosp. 1 TaxID=254839 RepID=UPI0024432F79|nr:CDP-glycerol glycerophosphotransferase family protein [Actinobacillus genomosp. 1]WGE33532.1 CDP-glycerol glycerophosphotransferase family protein [Actinobacillus genomosp. 1]